MNELVPSNNESLGSIEISPEVIQVIAGYAVRDVKGVFGMGNSGMMDDLSQWLGRSTFRKGVRVEIGDKVNIEVSLSVHYGVSMPEVGRTVQDRVKASVEMMTGLEVDEVKVKIEDVKFTIPTDKEDRLSEPN